MLSWIIYSVYPFIFFHTNKDHAFMVIPYKFRVKIKLSKRRISCPECPNIVRISVLTNLSMIFQFWGSFLAEIW
jgi:hypothetical protein